MTELLGTLEVVYGPPVKSTNGVIQESGTVTLMGLVGDRVWFVRDLVADQVITAKLKEGVPLLSCTSWRTPFGEDIISLPDGRLLPCGGQQANRELSQLLGREVELVRPSLEGDPPRTNYNFSLRLGAGYDSSPIHLVTTASLDTLGLSLEEGIRRLRPNLVIRTPSELTGFPEDSWDGWQIKIGSARLVVRKPAERCPMPGRPNGDLPVAPKLLRAMRRQIPGGSRSKMYAGLYLVVLDPGDIRMGDEALLVRRRLDYWH